MKTAKNNLIGYILLACAVVGEDPASYLRSLEEGKFRLFSVRTPNPSFTGEVKGVWFEQGYAEVTEELARSFLDIGFSVSEISQRF